jgi:hypothetical protein
MAAGLGIGPEGETGWKTPQATLSEAIGSRSMVSFSYKGFERVVEPHAIYDDKSGDNTLMAWQLSGGSGVGWRAFHTAHMSNVRATGQTFEMRGARPSFAPQNVPTPSLKPRRGPGSIMTS